MSLAWIDDASTLTKPKAVGSKQWLRPFPELASLIAFRQQYVQTAASWVPGVIDSPHPDLSDYFLILEDAPTGDGVYKWFRTWSKIPPSRTVSEAHQFYRPAFEGGTPAGALLTISGTPTNASQQTTITIASGHTLEANDSLEIIYSVFIPGVGQQSRTIYRTALSVNTPDVTVDIITDANAIVAWSTVQKVDPERASKSILAATEVEYSYVLPGKTPGITTVDDITIVSAFEGRGSNGGLTNTLSSTTTPSSATYQNWIGSGTKIVMEGTTIRRWMGSNIREIATRYGFAL